MTEAQENIFLQPKDAALFGRKYGHPDVQQACVGDESVQYVRKDVADLARPVTVAEAAKVLPLCKVCNQGVDMQAIGGTVNSNGKYWHEFCYKTQQKLDQAKSGWDECASRLKALSHEGGE